MSDPKPLTYRTFTHAVAALLASPGAEDLAIEHLREDDLGELFEQLRERIEAASGISEGVEVDSVVEPYAVQVVRSRATGEAVVMLTSAYDRSPAAIPVRYLRAPIYYSENGDGSVSLRVGKPGGLSSMWSVIEPITDIRATLAQLKAVKES